MDLDTYRVVAGCDFGDALSSAWRCLDAGRVPSFPSWVRPRPEAMGRRDRRPTMTVVRNAHAAGVLDDLPDVVWGADRLLLAWASGRPCLREVVATDLGYWIARVRWPLDRRTDDIVEQVCIHSGGIAFRRPPPLSVLERSPILGVVEARSVSRRSAANPPDTDRKPFEDCLSNPRPDRD